MLIDDCCSSAGAPQSPALQVWVEALHITHQPVCWHRLSGLFAGGTQDTQAARLTQATNLLDSPEAQTVAQACRVINTSVLPAITVQVCLSSACVCQTYAQIYQVVHMLACFLHNPVPPKCAECGTDAGTPCGKNQR